MVSFHTPLPVPDLNQTSIISQPRAENKSKKRKSPHTDADADADAEETLPPKHCKNSNPNKSSDMQLHLDTPLPSEWQRCLDIQSGEIHFYNNRTNKTTLRDPKTSPQPSTPADYGQMSLDLQLNLPCSSPSSEKTNPTTHKKSNNSVASASHLFMGASTAGKNSSTEIMEADQVMEMVATVCRRCHMLVMLCKSSPTCPNCKYMHPPYQTSTDLLKPRLSLSC